MKYKQKLVMWKKRAVRIVALHDVDELTFSEIAEKFKPITVQRVQQIYAREKEKDETT